MLAMNKNYIEQKLLKYCRR